MLTALVVAAGTLVATPAYADPGPKNGRPEVKSAERIVKGKPLAAIPRKPDPVPQTATWPTPGAAELRASGNAKVTANGRLFSLTAQGPTDVELDYSRLASAYGGSFGSRLRLVRLPACALTTPDVAACRTGTPVQARHDTERKTLTATIESQAATTVLAAVAGTSSDKGDYSASKLSPSATWNVSEQSGDFSWSYPMRVPPVPGSLEPEVSISYSSGTLDGRTSNTNNQPSWIGEGFGLWPGHIQRGYKPCSDDGAPKDEWGNSPGDRCWAYDNATISWNGKGGELIQAADGTWRMKDDDGTRIELLKDSAKANGDNDGEYWKVTGTDGTQYFFGLNRLPGWSSGKPETASAWTSPVFGDDAGEPCHGATFASSWCQQAYQWNLDYIVDPRGNAVSYFYTQERNHYGRNLKPADETPYVREGWLSRIEYGQRADTLFTVKAPARVTFGVAERCLPTSDFDCAESKITSNPTRWADVPWDLNCDAGTECKDTHGTVSPTFWSRKRLTSVTTQALKADGAYRNVDSWAVEHRWGDADIDRALLVKSITHTGHATTPAVTLPSVTFNHVQLPNRLDKIGDDIAPFVKYRVGAIYDESGGQIDVSYSGADCTLDALPIPETNTRRCFPVKWTPAGYADPITDWFHKYVVTQVVQVDRTGGAPDMLTNYAYLGGAAWHFDDDDGLTKEKDKTWSQWRGYGHVRMTTGGWNDPRSQTDYLYLRGMHGDRLNNSGGVKQVTVSDGEGGSHVDHEAFQGFELKKAEFDKPGGTVETKTVNTPWRHQTATRTRSWGTTTANLTGIGASKTWTLMDGGAWRQTETVTTHETTTGLPTQVDDKGDLSTTADDKCVRTSYAQNKSSWLLNLPSRVEAVSVNCSATPDRSKHVIEDDRSFYDGGAFGAAPTKGLLTKSEEIAAHDGTTPTYIRKEASTYDSYGRELTSTDALGNVTTTAYTDTAALNTQVKVTSPPAKAGDATTSQTTIKELDPAFSLPTAEIDASGKRTDLSYDALGRLTRVWLPDRSATAGQNPNLEYSYQTTDGAMVAIGTKRLTADGGQTTPSYQLYDGLLRPRQTQDPGPNGGRLITDNLYDSRGNMARKYEKYYSTGAPSATLFGPFEGNVESQKAYEHDGRNRTVLERFVVGNGDSQERWRTVTSYAGGRVTVDPPDGDTPATTLTDARGLIVELRQYRGDAPTGAYDKTTYTYTPRGRQATVTDPAGNTWTHHYDLRGREIQNDDPDRGTTTFTHDNLDRIISITDARGKKIVNEYDRLGRKVATRDGSATGPVISSWTYDTIRKGLLSGSTRVVDSQPYTVAVNAYDTLDRAIRTTVTIPVAEKGLSGSYVFDTRYRLDGTVQSTSLPAAGGLPAETVVHSYDELRRPTTTSGLSTYVTRSIHSLSGKPEQYELSAGGKKTWLTNAYEYGTQRLLSSRVDREDVAGVDRAVTYTYDPAGNITQIADVSRSGTDTQCFTHDYLRRLTEVWTQGTTTCAAAPAASVVGGVAPYWESFSYDLTGNRTKEVGHATAGTADTVRVYTYPASGQPHPHAVASVTQTGGAGDRTDSYDYDATGNTISRPGQALEWDPEGLLTKITADGEVTSFLYDADGNRLIRREPRATTLYLPGMELRLNTTTGGTEATRYYTHDSATVAIRRPSGAHFLAGDHNGTGEIAIDVATQEVVQRRFKPFGQLRGQPSGTWPGEKGFVGGNRDSSVGLTQLGVREYDPGLGRFISVDSIIDPQDPQQMNGYAYAGDSPVTFSDPDGKLIGSVFLSIARAVKKAVAGAAKLRKGRTWTQIGVGRSALDKKRPWRTSTAMAPFGRVSGDEPHRGWKERAFRALWNGYRSLSRNSVFPLLNGFTRQLQEDRDRDDLNAGERVLRVAVRGLATFGGAVAGTAGGALLAGSGCAATGVLTPLAGGCAVVGGFIGGVAGAKVGDVVGKFLVNDADDVGQRVIDAGARGLDAVVDGAGLLGDLGDDLADALPFG
ncbi:RHS repeat domain-containing protein [Nonomuraea turcica]|uniref:RHS repeat domain-containing protein n=1 Tax=Nonomuraea sp. G32 TaxID=3067274 RepID=UPI00273B5E41|nr:RHS repeat-associated core domain-containing protein [Nonomuraea sp. G32]MDP4505320.1 RHS repeat-associated core domain-containing protein [Nonomuraea sp. G32]